MIDLETLIQQIQTNCNISDAKHAGIYSICGLALRLRDLFKWEKGLPPWHERDANEVLEWIGLKEIAWEEYTDQEFRDLLIDGDSFDPFDTQKINAVLQYHQLYYGAGYANSLKPTFFLAPIMDREKIAGLSVFTLGPEMARDLLTLPALTQNNEVVLRTQAAKLYLWDQITYIRKSSRPALNLALDALGISKTDPALIRNRIEDIFSVLRENYIRHELGEIKDNTFDRNIWRKLISHFAHTPIELLARAVKDFLADTHTEGTLTWIIQQQDRAALGFYTAFLDGLGKDIFTTFTDGFREFSETNDWLLLKNRTDEQRTTVARIAQEMSTIYLEGQRRNDHNWIAERIDRSILASLLRGQ